MDYTSLPLRDGTKMPALGLGCWKLPRAQAADAVFAALVAGYRALDCAADYGNEKEVGAGIARAIAEGVVTRGDLWVTSKLWCTYHEPEHVAAALARTLADLGLAYVDLYLIHFPIPLKFVPFETRYPPEWLHDPAAPSPRLEFSGVPLIDTWRAMVALPPAGGARHVGVCNMTTGLLADLMRAAAAEGLPAPEVLQVEIHPHLVQAALARFCAERGVVVTAFSPLGAASYVEIGMAAPAQSALLDPVVGAVAARLGATPAQAVLAWHLRRGLSAVPKSSRPERLVENLGAAAFAPRLTDDDVRAFSALDRKHRYNDPGVFCEKAFNTFCPIFD